MSLNDDEKLILQDDQTLRAAGVGQQGNGTFTEEGTVSPLKIWVTIFLLQVINKNTGSTNSWCRVQSSS
ncbi:hypothetical protein ILYODFUR_026382 [Ilyodon furcidens]|uniref:Uncharacterized protein n=1 Tax=Ilyodon furcidens TaxID=33524 RepID=A0ABV0TR00_9TELE